MRGFNPCKSYKSVPETKSKRTLRQGMKGGLILRFAENAGPCLFRWRFSRHEIKSIETRHKNTLTFGGTLHLPVWIIL
jgi:hypothetical protein